MKAKSIDQRLPVALDLGKLLGFKHVAVSAGEQASLARALGAACNKVGGEIGKHQVDTNAIPLGVINNANVASSAID
jgi:hypothetical protein